MVRLNGPAFSCPCSLSFTCARTCVQTDARPTSCTRTRTTQTHTMNLETGKDDSFEETGGTMPRGTLYLYLIQLSKIILSEELCCRLGVREEHLQTCVPTLKEIKKVNAMLRERERKRERVGQRTGKCIISYCSTEVHNHVIANCCLHMCVRVCVCERDKAYPVHSA